MAILIKKRNFFIVTVFDSIIYDAHDKFNIFLIFTCYNRTITILLHKHIEEFKMLDSTKYYFYNQVNLRLKELEQAIIVKLVGKFIRQIQNNRG